MNFKIISLFFTLLFLLSPAAFADGFETSAKQAIVIDYESGAILFEKNADERMSPSSMSKVMTMYLVFDALKKGDLDLEDKFLVSEKAWSKKGSKMFVELGNKIKIEDLIRGVVVQSGNDATIVLAEGMAGSEEAFASALNREAKILGMNNSHFVNASGWPDPDHYSTARDLAVLARATIEEFPELYKIYAEPEFTYHDIKQANRNPLLGKNIGADGLKTGHTEDGGYGLIGTGVNKDGQRIIFVLNGMESSKERAQESIRLLQWGLNAFKSVNLFHEQNVLGDIPVYLGNKSSVKIMAKESISMLVPKLSARALKIDMTYDTPLKAPVQKGQEVGMIKVYIPEKPIPLEVPLIAAEPVEEMGSILSLVTKARLLTTGQGHFVYE